MAEPTPKASRPEWLDAVEAAGPDDDVFVYKPGSDVRGTVKKKDLVNLPLGWDLEPPDLTQDARLRKEAGGQKFQSFLEGAASTITLGTSDAVIGGLLDDKEYRVRARENTGSRLAGGILGAGLTLGGSAAITPGGLAVQAGKSVGTRVAGKEVAKKGVMGRMLPGLAQNSVEGALFGAGEGVAQTFISENPVNAEALLANVATGALFGAGVGGAVSGGGSLIGESIGLGRRYLAKGAQTIEGRAAKQADLARASMKPAELSPDVRARGQGELGAARGELSKATFEGHKAANIAHGELGAKNAAVGGFKKDYDLLDEYSGSILRRIEKAGDDATPEMWAAHEALTQARAQSREWLESKGVFKRSTALTNDTLDLAPEKKVKRINDWGDDASVAGSINHPDFPNVLAQQEDALMRAKSVMDGPPEGRAASMGVVDDEASLPFHEQVKLAAGRVGDDGVFGDRKVLIGDIYEQMPNKGSMSLDDFKARLVEENNAGNLRLNRADLPEALDPGKIAKSSTPYQHTEFHFLTEDVAGLRAAAAAHPKVTAPVKGSKAWAPHKVNRDVFKAVSDYDDVMLRATSGVDPQALAEVQARIDGLEKLLATGTPNSPATMAHIKGTVDAAGRAGIDVSWETVTKAAVDEGMDAAALAAMSPEARMLFTAKYAREAASRQLKAMAGEPLTMGQKVGRGILASAAGWAVGGHIGGILAGMVGGGLMGRLLRGTSIGLTRKMALNISDVGTKMAKGIDGFLGVAEKAARSAAVPRTAVQVLKSAAFGNPDGPKKEYKGSELQKLYQQRAAELQNMAASPGEAKRFIGEGLLGVRLTDAPLADQLADLALRRLDYLLKNMPKTHYPANPFSKSTHIPSDAEIASWARRAQIADHPEAIFDHMEDGTLTVEHVETLKAVYPKLYNEIHMDIISQAARLQATLPWERRVTLSTLFEAPTDDILRPELVGRLQAGYSEQSTEQANKPPQPPSTSRHSNPTKAQELAG